MEDKSLAKAIISRLETVGMVRGLVKQLAQMAIFDMLSKHHPTWEPDTDNEKEAEKLEKLRWELLELQAHIDSIHDLLTPEE